MENTSATSSAAPRLRRTLTLWDLILYGIIVIQPVAPMSVFGVLSDSGHGHVVTTLLIAMVAMLFTAFSYGRMARAYPSAGSAFTYVGQEINPALGYVTGWSMVMDYILNPMICIIWCSQQAFVFAPAIPCGTCPGGILAAAFAGSSGSPPIQRCETRAASSQGCAWSSRERQCRLTPRRPQRWSFTPATPCGRWRRRSTGTARHGRACCVRILACTILRSSSPASASIFPQRAQLRARRELRSRIPRLLMAGS